MTERTTQLPQSTVLHAPSDRQGCVAGAEQCLIMFEPMSQKDFIMSGQEV